MKPSDADEPSTWIKSTAGLLARAYPDGLPESDYAALIEIFLLQASQRNVANLIGLFTRIDRGVVYNDVLGVDAGDVVVSALDRGRVLELLQRAGYDAWLLEQGLP